MVDQLLLTYKIDDRGMYRIFPFWIFDRCVLKVLHNCLQDDRSFIKHVQTNVIAMWPFWFVSISVYFAAAYKIAESLHKLV